MNERINELFEQALEEFNAENKYATIIVPNPLKEKFAELIVEECGEVAYKAYWDNPETVRGIHIQEKIKQHFGVEE